MIASSLFLLSIFLLQVGLSQSWGVGIDGALRYTWYVSKDNILPAAVDDGVYPFQDVQIKVAIIGSSSGVKDGKGL